MSPTTHAIGTGTANLSINVPVDERDFLRAFAASEDSRSMGDFLRQIILDGIRAHNALAADQLINIRRRYYGAALAALFVLLTAHAWFTGHTEDFRRPRTARITRTVRRAEEVA